ncbi:MAG: VOC family protein [Chloroflexi bacterium]|nr:MAG: VOC family protein [Chloroflexota bacterium]TMD64180.1 MAG: VOC family protein [Chloroflexota bacterium]
MLKGARAQTALPAQDLDRAKAFYRDKLGLEPFDEDAGNVRFRVAGGNEFNVFRTMGAPSGTHTQMAFIVEDIVGEVKELKSRGVTFEEYDFPGLKTKDGIAEGGDARVAWFKDSEGNLLNIVQPARVPAGRTA